jgi:hypothetical protein
MKKLLTSTEQDNLNYCTKIITSFISLHTILKALKSPQSVEHRYQGFPVFFYIINFVDDFLELFNGFLC